MSILQAQPGHHPIWPAAVIILGLSLTLSWVLLLVFGLFRLIEYSV